MATQTFIIATLPNGPGSGKNLKLSLYLTPRLDHGATLANFPDMLSWPRAIQAHGLRFQIACGGKNATVSINSAVLRPDLWDILFGPKTFVETYKIPEFEKGLIVSYPARQGLSYLKYAYQRIGLLANAENERGPLEVLRPLVFRNGAKSVLTKEISEIRVEIWNQQRAAMRARGVPKRATPWAAFRPTSNPDGVATNLIQPNSADTHDAMTRFSLFHHVPPAPNHPPFPDPSAGGFDKTLDFHKALTALSSYPTLLRALGLVFDVEIPASLCPNSPSAGAYGTIAVAKVIPGFKWKLKPQFNLTGTAYWRDASWFCAASAAAPADQAAGNYGASDVFKGFLAMSPQDFFLSQVDLDGALLKALSLADNFQNMSNLGNSAAIDAVLPSLRSAGISLMADGRGLQLLQSLISNKSFDSSLAAGTAAPRPYNARDLVRGYRIDLWSSRTQRWHSLHERTATYQFGADGKTMVTAQEEGFTQLAASQAADDPKRKPDAFASEHKIPGPEQNVYIHERVARWDGWSLSATRPGKVLNRSADPAKALDSDPSMNAPVTPFKMATSFAATAGSLPELRFGANYRLRARTVDLAGNSVSLDTSAPDSFVAPADAVQMKYLRFEPVSPPLLVLQKLPRAGGSLERLVIRSRNTDVTLDMQTTSETDQRHVGPPAAAERLVEQHGMLDKGGKLNGAAATFAMITRRDGFRIPEVASPTLGKVPLVPGASLTVGYLPDPLARGAAFRNLPNTPDDTDGVGGKSGLTYATLAGADPRPGSVTFIDFGTQPWPNASAFRLMLTEGSVRPKWDDKARVLTFSLPKGTVVSIPTSCYLDAADLDFMGVWGWLREFFEAAELNTLQQAAQFLPRTSDTIAQFTRLILEGGHEMITPMRTLTLVHAVQQPLGEPTFLQLPVVHDPSAPIFASALRNSFTPITAWRVVDSHQAVLLGGLRIHGGSSAKLDLEARWLEVTDDPTMPAPTESVASQAVETIDMSSLDGGPIYSDATQTRMVALYIPKVDTLWFSGPTDQLEGVQNPSSTDPAAPVHNFNDTRHRWVVYSAIATSRFKEYFPEPGLDFTRTGPTLVVDVPSSARPLVPDINYVVPTFGWERQETSNVKSNVRRGSSVRVYLNRGWYSSGQDELLGVVVWSGGSAPPDYQTRENLKMLFSQWGADPIWANGSLDISPLPTIFDFPGATATATGLTLAESPLLFDVAAHEVAYEPNRGLWYCDIQIANLFSYSPFIRLAFARYQSHSIQGVELSPVALADFVQLTPDRSAVMSINPANPRVARLFVGGLAPMGPLTSTLQITVENRAKNIESDLDWQTAPASAVQVVEDAGEPAEPNAVLWSGTITFTKTPPRGQFRVVIKEFENLAADAASRNLTDPPTTAPRLVYTAILAYDYL